MPPPHPPSRVVLLKQPEGLIYKQLAKRAYCPEGAPALGVVAVAPRHEVPSLLFLMVVIMMKGGATIIKDDDVYILKVASGFLNEVVNC